MNLPPDGQARVERGIGILKDHLHLLQPRAALRAGQGGQINPFVQQTPRCLPLQPRDDPAQRQRIAIARAIATNPSVIVADEPVSALDVTIREQIIALMEDLKGETAYLFISHDMAVVARICDRIAVMYRGQVVEVGTADEVIGNPQHAYTRSLLEAVPRVGRRRTGARLFPWQPKSATRGPLEAVSPTHQVRQE